MVLLLLGLLLTGGLYTAFSPAQAQEQESEAELAAQGRELFLVGCSFCHGQNGEGISDAREGYQVGPSLVGVGAAAVDFQVGTGRMPLAQPAAQAPKKKVVYNEEEIAALAAYVASLGPGPAIPDEQDYSIEGLSEDEREEAIARGGQIFLTNCTACHNFAGAGGALPEGKYAPSLYDVSPLRIYEAMLIGPQQMPVFADNVITPDDKRAIIAYLEDLHAAPDRGGLSLGTLGPVSEGLWAWMLGLGSLIGFAVWIAAKGARAR